MLKPIYYKREQIFNFHIKKLEKEEKTTSEPSRKNIIITIRAEVSEIANREKPTKRKADSLWIKK